MLDLILITLFFGAICFGTLVISAALMYKFSKEEHRKDFLKINVKGWNIRNLILNVMLSPIYWFIQMGIILAFSILLLFFMLIDPVYTLWEALLTFFAAGAISLSATILYAMVIWLLDYKDREPLRIFPTLFLWGCMAAIISFFINTILSFMAYDIFPEVIVMMLSSAVIAPIVEESAKGAGLFVVSRTKQFSGILDGVMYGFIVGMGFAFIEDWAYYTQYPPMDLGMFDWIGFIFMRSILTGAAHGILTGTTGLFLGIAKARNSKKTWLWLAAGLLSAIILHALFNGLSIVEAFIFVLTGFEIPILYFYMGILLIALIAVVVKGMMDYQKTATIRELTEKKTPKTKEIKK